MVKTKLTKEELELIMISDMPNILAQWENEGIIYETQFESISQSTIERNLDEITEIMIEHGAEVDTVLPDGVDMERDGFMYFIFDPSRISLKSAESRAKDFFKD